MFDSTELKFKKKKWHSIKMGELVKVLKDEEFPSDIVLLKSDKDSGIVFVDTMNLDGEVSFFLILLSVDKSQRKDISKRA